MPKSKLKLKQRETQLTLSKRHIVRLLGGLKVIFRLVLLLLHRHVSKT
jgi:hypothetical protein